MKTIRSSICLALAALICFACAPREPQTEYPHLEQAILLNSDLNRVQQEYDEYYMFADPETQMFMETEILPQIFAARDMINIYTDMALRGLDDREMRNEIRFKLRGISADILGAQ